MSINVIVASNKKLVIVTDQRSMTALPFYSPKSSLIATLFFDHSTKLFVFDPPHNYIAVCTSGMAEIQGKTISHFFNEFRKELPQRRLSIEDYAKRMSDFFFNEWSKINTIKEVELFPEELPKFMVAGFDEGNNLGLIYKFAIPLKPSPILFGKERRGLIKAGEIKYLEETHPKFQNEFIKGTRNKLASKQSIGFALSDQENRLHQAFDKKEFDKIVAEDMSLEDIKKYAKASIEFSISEQTLRNDLPVTGGGIDLITITPMEGVNTTQLTNETPKGVRPLAETNKHHLAVTCCGTQKILQIDFGSKKELNIGFIRYPANELYICAKCRHRFNLESVRENVEQIARNKIVR